MRTLLIAVVLCVFSATFAQTYSQQVEKKWFNHVIETAQSESYHFVPKGTKYLKACVIKYNLTKTSVVVLGNEENSIFITGESKDNGKTWKMSYSIQDKNRNQTFKGEQVDKFVENEIRATYDESEYTTSLY